MTRGNKLDLNLLSRRWLEFRRWRYGGVFSEVSSLTRDTQFFDNSAALVARSDEWHCVKYVRDLD